MQDGIYHASFATVADTGQGLAVIKSGSVNGGDDGYLYTGSVSEVGGALSGTLQISRWNTGSTSVFGPLNEFQLQLTGRTTAGGFEASGSTPSMPGVQIKIVGRYLKSAA